MTFAFARAHWRALCVALGLALAFGAGRLSKRQPPAPAVAMREDTAVREASAAKVDQHRAEGPETITTVEEDFEEGGAGRPSRTVASAPLGVPSDHTAGVSDPYPANENLPTGPVLVKRITTVDQRGPVVTDTHEIASSSESVQTHLDLKLTPPPSGPRFSFGLGLEDPLGAQRPHFEVGMRVLTVPLLETPLWLRLGSTPSRGLLHGATITGEIQW